jgi:predicted AlkP superfamily pyrophosphatase or phosphodiesterase
LRIAQEGRRPTLTAHEGHGETQKNCDQRGQLHRSTAQTDEASQLADTGDLATSFWFQDYPADFSLVLKMPEENKNLHAINGKSFFRIIDDKKSRGMERDFHVFSEDTGDVLIVTAPGYHLDFNAGTGASVGNFFQPSTFFGQHGHDPQLPEMKAIFYAAGPDFKPSSLKEVDAVDIAPTVAELLEIQPPQDAQGKNILTGNRHQR